jgi:hypothetical protein
VANRLMRPPAQIERREVQAANAGRLSRRWASAAAKLRERWRISSGAAHRPRPYFGTMKGFGKIALMFGLLGGLMAYFIVPVQFSRKRTLSPADKAEYALTVNYYQSHCGPVLPEIEERAKAYARESGEDIWVGFDAMLQHRGLLIGSPMTWCRYMGALWLKPR